MRHQERAGVVFTVVSVLLPQYPNWGWKLVLISKELNYVKI